MFIKFYISFFLSLLFSFLVNIILNFINTKITDLFLSHMLIWQILERKKKDASLVIIFNLLNFTITNEQIQIPFRTFLNCYNNYDIIVNE